MIKIIHFLINFAKKIMNKNNISEFQDIFNFRIKIVQLKIFV